MEEEETVGVTIEGEGMVGVGAEDGPAMLLRLVVVLRVGRLDCGAALSIGGGAVAAEGGDDVEELLVEGTERDAS